MRYDPRSLSEMPGEIGRVLRCINMAMGCLDPLSNKADERLAWFRLLDALDGNEPRNSLEA